MKPVVMVLCALALWCVLLPAIAQTEPAERADVKALLASLNDASPEVRGGAALGALDDPRAIAPLFDLLRKDPDPIVRMKASQAIDAFRDPGAVDALFAELTSDHLESLACAIWALGRFPDPRIADRMAELMEKHPHPYVRGKAAETLGGKRDLRAVEALIAQLGSTIPGERALAAQLLGMIGDPRAVEALIAVMRNPEENDIVPGRAATALGKIGDQRAIQPLVTALKDPAARHEAAAALVEIGPPAIPELLQEEDPAARRRAIDTLARFGDDQVVEPFIAALGDEDLGVRYAAVSGLSAFPRDPRIVEPLIAVLRQAKPELRDPALEKEREERHKYGELGGVQSIDEPRVDTIKLRIRAAEVLGWTHDRRAALALLAALEDDDRWVRQAAKNALLVNRRVTGDDLAPLLAGNDRDMLFFAIELMGYAGDERSVTLLLTLLKHEDPPIRAKSALALGYCRDPRIAAALRELLTDPDAGVRANAAWSLGELEDQTAFADLLSLLQRDGERSVRTQTALALGKLGDPRAVDALIAALQTDDTSQYAAASQALDKIGDPRAIEPLIRGTKHRIDSVRWQAYTALWIFKDDPRVIDAVIALVNEPVPHMRATVIRILATMDDPRVPELLLAALNDPESEVLVNAAGGLGRLSEQRAVEPLIALIEQGQGREEFFLALGKLKDPRAVLPIVRALHNPNRHVHAKAIWALGETGGEIALNELLEYARGDSYDYRPEALQALGNFHDPRAEAVLRLTLADRDPVMRGWAAVSLTRSGHEQPSNLLLDALRNSRHGELMAAAAALLVERKELQAVEPLIILLEDQPLQISEMALKALRALTGQDFGDDAGKWRAWWDARE